MLNEGIRRVIHFSKYARVYTYVSITVQEEVYLKHFQELLDALNAECIVDFDVRRSSSLKDGDYVFSLFPLHKWIHRN